MTKRPSGTRAAPKAEPKPVEQEPNADDVAPSVAITQRGAIRSRDEQLADVGGRLHAFRINHDGSLASLGSVPGIPSGAAGLVDR